MHQTSKVISIKVNYVIVIRLTSANFRIAVQIDQKSFSQRDCMPYPFKANF